MVRARVQHICCGAVSSIHGKEVVPMKSQQCGHLNKTFTTTPPVNMASPTGEVGILQGTIPRWGNGCRKREALQGQAP